MLSLGQLIKDRSRSSEEEPLLTFVSLEADGSYRTSHRNYGSLWRRGQAMARVLAAQGLVAGDRFALMMENHCEFVDLMVASSILGTVFVPIDPRTKGKKLEFMLSSVGCRGVIAGSYCLDSLNEVVGVALWIRLVGPRDDELDLPSHVSWLEDDHEGPELPVAVRDLNAPMQLIFTSGTTGDPKAIVGSYRRYASMSSLVVAFGIKSSDRMYTGLSLTHSNAMAATLGGSLYNAIPAVISQRFSKSRLWSIIRDFRCTTLNLLGGMFTSIYSEPETDQDATNPLRLVLGSGMPKDLWEPFARRFGVEVLEFYGAAEGGITINLPGTGPIGSIGKPPPNLVARILDEADLPLAPMQPGEIVFENSDGSPLLVDYLNNPEASAAKTRGGMLRMGDIGYRDEQGWFYFLHRKGSELRRNGDFISPGFLEKEIAEHPNVDDVFVYGVKSSNGVPGEKDLVAAVVLRDTAAWEPSSLFSFCEARLERNSVPSYLQIVSAIPKTASEKPIERALLESFAPSAPNVFVRGNGVRQPLPKSLPG